MPLQGELVNSMNECPRAEALTSDLAIEEAEVMLVRESQTHLKLFASLCPFLGEKSILFGF